MLRTYRQDERVSPALIWSGYLLGFALGGFFDGILLHQILQWHHLLSGVDSGGSIRTLILWDGLFHALMYLIAAVGFVLLVRVRRDFALPGADCLLMASALISFGLWHVVDGAASHWLLGLHRIRMDVENPLFWDLLWFFVFGVAFIAAGVMMRRNPGKARGLGRGPRALSAIVLVAGPLAAMPPKDAPDAALVLFQPTVSAAEAMAAITESGARLIWVDARKEVWAVDFGEGAAASALYRNGAMIVSSSLLPAGCFSWSRA